MTPKSSLAQSRHLRLGDQSKSGMPHAMARHAVVTTHRGIRSKGPMASETPGPRGAQHARRHAAALLVGGLAAGRLVGWLAGWAAGCSVATDSELQGKLLQARDSGLVIRGKDHWSEPSALAPNRSWCVS